MSAIVTGVLVGLAVALTLACAVGVWAMRDPLQRLHFISPASTLAPFFLFVAVVVGEPDRQAAIKTALTLILLAAMNGVVTHATARAYRVRQGKPPGRPTTEEAA